MITPNANEQKLAANLLDEVLSLPLREAQEKAIANALSFSRWLAEQETQRVRRTADAEIAHLQLERATLLGRLTKLEAQFVLPEPGDES